MVDTLSIRADNAPLKVFKTPDSVIILLESVVTLSSSGKTNDDKLVIFMFTDFNEDEREVISESKPLTKEEIFLKEDDNVVILLDNVYNTEDREVTLFLIVFTEDESDTTFIEIVEERDFMFVFTVEDNDTRFDVAVRRVDESDVTFVPTTEDRVIKFVWVVLKDADNVRIDEERELMVLSVTAPKFVV